MAKGPTLNDITTSFGSRAAFNQWAADIEAAWQNVLSLDGSTPNTMSADLDMGDQDIINVGELKAASLRVDGTLVSPTTTLTGVESSAVNYNQGDTNAVDVSVEDKLKEVVSVKDFGAVGDGSTDDTTAIQNAIDYAQPLHKTLYFPEGTYIISADLDLVDTDDFEMAGAGCGDFVSDTAATTIKAASGVTSIFRLNYTSATTYGIKWRNMRLDGAGIATYAIRSDNFFPAGRLDRVSIDNVDYGVFLEESCWGWHFNEVLVRVSNIGFDLRDKNHNAYFSGCVTRSVSGSTPATGVRLGNTASSSSVTFVGCDFEMDSPTTAQVYIKQARAVSILGCYFENRGTTSAVVLGDSALTVRVDGVTITGSHFQKDTGSYAIRTHNVEGVSITGNHFTSGVDYDIDTDTSSTYNKSVYVKGNRYSPNGLMSDASFNALNSQTLTQASSITANLIEGENLNMATATVYGSPIDLTLSNHSISDVVTLYVDNTSAGTNTISFNTASFSNVANQALLTTETGMFTFKYIPALGKFVEISRDVN